MTALAAALDELSRRTRMIAWTTPLDLAHHRRLLTTTLTRGVRHYPERFTFPPCPAGTIHRLAGAADVLVGEVDDPAVAQRVRAHLAAVLERVDALAAHDADALSAACQRSDGLPSAATVAWAERLLAARPEPETEPGPTHDTDFLVAAVRDALARYRLDGWQVAVRDDMAARASVRGRERVVNVRAGLAIDARQVRRLVAHEVGGHVLRWENAREQPEPLVAVPLGDAVATEEGLAVLVEEQLGVMDPAQLRVYAARAVAVAAATEQGIVPIARRLADQVGVETAVDVALRVKRGMTDPNLPGGVTKDHGYLSGFDAVRGLAPRELGLLRASKWPVALLPELAGLAARGRLRAPRRVPERTLLLDG